MRLASAKIYWNGFGRVCILAAGILYFKARAKSAARKEQCSSHEWSLSSKSRFASGTHVSSFLLTIFRAGAGVFGRVCADREGIHVRTGFAATGP